jgi:predicted HAD superfamily phosphohydrolase YqeG
MGEWKMKIFKPEWLSLSKEIKLKLIRLAILDNQRGRKVGGVE